MKRFIVSIASISLLASGFPLLMANGAQAADLPKPAQAVCSEASAGKTYACMQVNKPRVPSGDTVVFTGSLSKAAQKAVKDWTKGDNIVCLTRYKTTPEADGSWPWTVLEGACTTVRKNGEFTIEAELGRKGSFYYGLEAGPCRASRELCGNADSMMIGVYGKDDKALLLKTT
jgi:hypothetical protein